MTQRAVNRKGWGTRDTDVLVAVTNADTTASYLDSKIAVAGGGIAKAVLNPGGNEQLQLTVAPDTDELAGVTAADTTPGYLNSKISAGTGISTAVLNPAANEQLQISTVPSTIITAGIPYKQIWFPAGSMSGGYGTAEPVFQNKRIAAQTQCFDVWSFTNTCDQWALWTWAFSDWDVNVASLSIILYPVWYQDNESSAPSPTEYVRWLMNIGNRNYDGDLNYNLDPGANNAILKSPVLDQWHVAGGDSTGNQKGGEITVLQGTNPATANVFNLLQFMIKRTPCHADDTFDSQGDDAHLLGVAMQYKVNAANIAQWDKV